jgi:hypothetical protein
MLEVMRNMALGLEIADGVAIGMEVTKVQATILQRWDWYGAKPGAAMARVHQPRHRRAARAEPLREVPNCTTAVDKTGELNAREGAAFRLQIMGVFTLCGLLATLGWGGMTGLIVVISKIWPSEEVKEHKDVSTSTRSLDGQGQMQQAKAAVMSPQEERARWEWPRRTVLATRRVKRENERAPSAWCERRQKECKLETSTRSRPSEGSVSDIKDQEQSACQEELKKRRNYCLVIKGCKYWVNVMYDKYE